jgi:hypothetical protein
VQLLFISFKIGTILIFTVDSQVLLTLIVLEEVLKAETQIRVILRNTLISINALILIFKFHITLLHIALKTISNYL